MFEIIVPQRYYDLNIVERREYLNSKTEYCNFYDWLKKIVEEAIEDVEYKEMHYLDDSIKNLNIKLHKNYNKKNELKNILNLNSIEFKNKDVFSEFLSDTKFEHEFMSKYNNNKDYEYYNRFISWADSTQDYVEEAVETLAKSKIEQINIVFKFESNLNLIDSYDEYRIDFEGELMNEL